MPYPVRDYHRLHPHLESFDKVNSFPVLSEKLPVKSQSAYSYESLAGKFFVVFGNLPMKLNFLLFVQSLIKSCFVHTMRKHELLRIRCTFNEKRPFRSMKCVNHKLVIKPRYGGYLIDIYNVTQNSGNFKNIKCFRFHASYSSDQYVLQRDGYVVSSYPAKVPSIAYHSYFPALEQIRKAFDNVKWHSVGTSKHRLRCLRRKFFPIENGTYKLLDIINRESLQLKLLYLRVGSDIGRKPEFLDKHFIAKRYIGRVNGSNIYKL